MNSRLGTRRIADLKPLPAGRVALLAEYPYYRADHTAWRGNLRALKALGATVITAYVPWRLHELDPEIDGESGYDFTGRTHRQRDVVGFCGDVAEAGLMAILKPGPFIHAEIRLGGLPERLTKLTPRLSVNGAVITDEGEPAPSAHSVEFAASAAEWLHMVRKELVDLVAYPDGPVIGLQIGNEGLFSDLHKPINIDDFSDPALKAHSRWFGRQTRVPTDPVTRENWVRWSGIGTREVLTSFKNILGDQLPVAVNLPLPGLSGSQRLPETWLARAAEAVPEGALVGNTSWSGNAMFSDEALTALWLGTRFLRTDVVEDNWGFTWTDDSYATPAVPLYHSLLGLAFGSSTISVYTACTTYHWAPHMGPNVAGVLKEGGKPEDFAPPYCPGAPLDEFGATHPNAAALRLLATFAEWFGRELRSVTAEPGPLLVVDPVAVAASAWPGESPEAPSPLSTAVAAAVRWLIRDGVEVDVVRPDEAAALMTEGRDTWLVVGGSAMGRETQRRLAGVIAGGHQCVVVGPLPERDETGQPCDALAQALLAGTTGRHVPLPAADVLGATELVHTVLAGRAPERDHELLVLRRTDLRADITVLYLFNRADSEQVYSGRVTGTGVTVSVGPRGVAVLVLARSKLQGFLINQGTAGSRQGLSSLLTVGQEEIPLTQAGHIAGRRSPAGWEFRSI